MQRKYDKFSGTCWEISEMQANERKFISPSQRPLHGLRRRLSDYVLDKMHWSVIKCSIDHRENALKRRKYHWKSVFWKWDTAKRATYEPAMRRESSSVEEASFIPYCSFADAAFRCVSLAEEGFPLVFTTLFRGSLTKSSRTNPWGLGNFSGECPRGQDRKKWQIPSNFISNSTEYCQMLRGPGKSWLSNARGSGIFHV